MSEDRELSALYQSAEKPQPSTALDETIRSAAQREAKPERSHAPQWFGGIAASLFAALLVTQLIPIQEQEDAFLGKQANSPAAPTDNVGLIESQEAEIPQAAAITETAATARAQKETKTVAKTKRVTPQKSESELARSIKPAMRSRSTTLEKDEADAGSLADDVQMPGMMQFMNIPTLHPELQTITDLLDAGKILEAREKLELFKKRHPEERIPDGILKKFSAQSR
ncbi:hypothetical protein MNBD_GAMMA15-741 [hydrothermal vent metagenome]|uniref:Uncharacterized protein n=1 Tax=hydrothermal vent metagenome TaxID=652676 RepID=A0A3B0YF71_9ZZZZ